MARTGEKLSSKTIAKMRTVVAAVLAEPQFYDQAYFPDHPSSKCGTICCAAGWVVWVDDPERYQKMVRLRGVAWTEVADRILGIHSYARLFYSSEFWPARFRNAYLNADTPRGRAQAMADRWEHYIATDGAK